MNDDSRIERYLASRADAITLAPADAASVTKRGHRRRNQKRGGVLAAVAVLGALGTSVVLQDPDDSQAVDADYATAVVPSTLDWTVVQPEVGLGYGSSTTALSDGSLYALSTAPGPMTGQQSSNQHLYRSTDGLEWAEVRLPTGLRTSSLSGDGDTLYAVGTAPGGGSARRVSVAASSDGGDTWTTVSLPEELAQLDRDHPGMLNVSSPSVAALDATHQVATFTVSANIDPHSYRDDIPDNSGWEATDTGVTIYEPMDESCFVAASTTIVDTDDANADPALTEEELERLVAARGAACSGKDSEQVVLATYTWDELGVPAEIQGYVGGETFTYATDDGTTFARVVTSVDTVGWSSAKVVSTDDGYRLLVSSSARDASSTTVLTSADGVTWTTATVLDGGLNSAGLLGDRPAVSTWTAQGKNVVKVEQADGTWTSLDIGSAVTAPAGQDTWVGEVAFGPLGVAATVTTSPRDGNGTVHSYLVHSADGVQLSVLDLAEYLDGESGYASGLTVTADAITVRAVHGPDGKASTVEPTDVLIGTPQ